MTASVYGAVQLDTTGSDIQPVGTSASAGTSGFASAADHVHPAGGPSGTWVNAITQGADPTGVTASDTALLAWIAAAAGQVAYLPSGRYLVSGSTALALATAGSEITGDGYGSSVIVVGGTFTGAEVFSVQADSCTIRDISVVGANTGSAALGGSQAWDAVKMTGQQHCTFSGLFFQYVNGWCIESVGGAGRANLDTEIDDVICRNSAGGLHLKGVTGSSFQGEHFLTGKIQLQQIGTGSGASANLDALRIEDIADVEVDDINVGLSGGTGSAVNIAGACTAVYFGPADIGGGSPAVIIQAGANGSPTDIRFSSGTIQESTSGPNLTVSGASGGIECSNIYFHRSSGDGVSLSNTGPPSSLTGCRWNTNDQAGTTGYDLNASAATARWDVSGGNFGTTVGAGSGQVTAPVNDPSGVVNFTGTRFSGTGVSTANFGAVNYSGCTVGSTLGLTSVPVSGQLLAVPVAYAPGTQTLLTSTAQAFAAVSSSNVNTGSFIAPASGSVLVEATFVAQSSSSSDAIAFALCAHGTVTPLAGTAVEWKPSTTTPGPATARFYVTGLTAGTSYNLDLMFAVQSGGTVTVYAYGQASASPVLSSSGVGSAVIMTVRAV